MHYDQYTLTKNEPGVFVTRTEQFLLSFWKHHAVCCLCVCSQTKRDRGGVQQAEPSQRRGRGELVTLRASSPISLSIHPPSPPLCLLLPLPSTWPHKHTAAQARTLLYECEKRSERGQRLDDMTSDSSVGPPGRFQLSVELRHTVRTQWNACCSSFMPTEPLAQLN